MKKYIYFCITFCMILGACGCGHKEKGTEEQAVSSQETAEERTEEQAASSQETAEEESVSETNGSQTSAEEDEIIYEERNSTDADDLTVTQKGRLREDMPEFSFQLTAEYESEMQSYAVQSLVVTEGDTVIQEISIPELTLFGQTAVYDSMQDTLGFALEDVNFDGYQDIRLFDTPNGNYRQEWIYLVWNPAEQRFEHDARLNAISLAAFDEKEQLIYGMERGGAVSHYFSTYQYIDGEPVRIRYEEEEGFWLGDEQTRQYCMAATGKEEQSSYEGTWFYIHVMERDEQTGELVTVSEEYVFSSSEEEGSEERGEIRIDVSSELGQQIKVARGR